MPFVRIVQSFDGHPIGSVVERTDKQAASDVVKRAAVLLDCDGEVATTRAKPKRKATKPVGWTDRGGTFHPGKRVAAKRKPAANPKRKTTKRKK